MRMAEGPQRRLRQTRFKCPHARRPSVPVIPNPVAVCANGGEGPASGFLHREPCLRNASACTEPAECVSTALLHLPVPFPVGAQHAAPGFPAWRAPTVAGSVSSGGFQAASLNLFTRSSV
jgi:hypothetical protein